MVELTKLSNGDRWRIGPLQFVSHHGHPLHGEDALPLLQILPLEPAHVSTGSQILEYKSPPPTTGTGKVRFIKENIQENVD